MMALLAAKPIERVINRSQLECDRAGAILPRSDWERPSTAERKGGTKVRAGTKAKPPGVGALAALLSVAQGQRHEVF
jgi:hypothetical protein